MKVSTIKIDYQKRQLHCGLAQLLVVCVPGILLTSRDLLCTQGHSQLLFKNGNSHTSPHLFVSFHQPIAEDRVCEHKTSVHLGFGMRPNLTRAAVLLCYRVWSVVIRALIYRCNRSIKWKHCCVSFAWIRNDYRSHIRAPNASNRLVWLQQFTLYSAASSISVRTEEARTHVLIHSRSKL